MKHHFFNVFMCCLIACAGLLIGGCELATNPLLFDGSPVTANFTINTTGNSYSDSKTINLNDVISSIDLDIDSVSVINVTLHIDSLSGGTLPATTVSGTGTIDGHTLVTLTNVPLSTFASERSIFDPTLSSSGVAYGAAGIAYVNGLLKHPESLPASITVAVSGTASQSGLHFKAHVKLYCQVFTTP